MAKRTRQPDGSATVAAQIRAYHAQLPPPARKVLKALLAEIRASAPDARFALDAPLPRTLIRRLIKARVAEMA